MEEHDTSAETIGTLYAVQDWQQLFITAHSLKGILASFGEEQTVVRLEKIESISRSHAAPDKADIEAVVKELHHIKSQISDYLAARQ
jgi:HPt (histidine-containing phosphotransfer) domain-containing protein